MNETTQESFHRQTATRALAVIGFITLIGVGVWLAVYSTRFVPPIVSRIGTAAVYLGSVFTPATPPSLSVVPTASTTPFSEASSTLSTGVLSTSEPVTVSTVPPRRRIQTTAGATTNTTYQITSTTTSVATPNGLPDFIVNITAIGYLATTSVESFVASSTVPNGSRPAVRFTIKNVGMGTSGSWRFSASIPTQTAYIYQSQLQQPLSPGDSIDYTLGFDQANRGAGQMVSVTANFDHAVTESNANNNSASANITILGN